MEIGIYTECLSRRHTGVEVMARALVDGLIGANQSVTCFHSRSRSHPDIPGVRHHLFRPAPAVPVYQRFAAAFRRHCFDGLDVLHIPSPQFPYVATPSIPTIVTVHDVIPVFFPQYHHRRRVIYFRHVLPLYLRHCRAIIAISQATRDDLIRHYGLASKKIRVIPNALPPGPYRSATKEDYILFVGTLEPRKNIPGLVRAFGKIVRRGHSTRLVIAGGEGWGFEDVFRLVRELGLEDKIDFKGYVSDEEKIDLYSKSRVFVWPSFYEGFGLPVLEAMACGVPVVTSANSSLPEVAGDAGIFVDPMSDDDIARGILQVLESATLAERLSVEGRKRAQRFDLQTMIASTLELYREVLE